MTSTLKTITAILLFFAIGVSCSDQSKTPLNPNGDSELALLMRAMFDEAETIKQQIENNEPLTLSLDHEKILTAHATEPEKAASPEYKAFAKTYLQAINSLKTVQPDQRIKVYETMVDNCMTCHQALCPGPMVRIKKLQ